MRIEAVKEVETEDPNENLLALFLDHHNGPLGVHLDSFQLYDNYRVLPSQSFRDIIRQIICGLEELWKNGFYHGDLTMNNILVSKRAQVLIKLYNFRTRDIPKEDAQLEDCVAVGSLLQHISNELKSLNPHLIYSLIDELASTLTGLTNIASLQTVEEMMCKQLFFWEPRRRMIFWIHDVPKALENAGCDRIIRAHNWKLPWDSRTHPGLLKAMNDYRFEEERRKSGNSAQVTPENTKYNANDSLHYVKCISGAYTHEDQLQGKILNNFGYKLSVDAAVCSKDPELFIVVFKILKDQGMILD